MNTIKESLPVLCILRIRSPLLGESPWGLLEFYAFSLYSFRPFLCLTCLISLLKTTTWSYVFRLFMPCPEERITIISPEHTLPQVGTQAPNLSAQFFGTFTLSDIIFLTLTLVKGLPQENHQTLRTLSKTKAKIHQYLILCQLILHQNFGPTSIHQILTQEALHSLSFPGNPPYMNFNLAFKNDHQSTRPKTKPTPTNSLSSTIQPNSNPTMSSFLNIFVPSLKLCGKINTLFQPIMESTNGIKKPGRDIRTPKNLQATLWSTSTISQTPIPGTMRESFFYCDSIYIWNGSQLFPHKHIQNYVSYPLIISFSLLLPLLYSLCTFMIPLWHLFHQIPSLILQTTPYRPEIHFGSQRSYSHLHFGSRCGKKNSESPSLCQSTLPFTALFYFNPERDYECSALIPPPLPKLPHTLSHYPSPKDFQEVSKIVWIMRWGFFIGCSGSSNGSQFLLCLAFLFRFFYYSLASSSWALFFFLPFFFQDLKYCGSGFVCGAFGSSTFFDCSFGELEVHEIYRSFKEALDGKLGWVNFELHVLDILNLFFSVTFRIYFELADLLFLYTFIMKKKKLTNVEFQLPKNIFQTINWSAEKTPKMLFMLNIPLLRPSSVSFFLSKTLFNMTIHFHCDLPLDPQGLEKKSFFSRIIFGNKINESQYKREILSNKKIYLSHASFQKKKYIKNIFKNKSTLKIYIHTLTPLETKVMHLDSQKERSRAIEINLDLIMNLNNYFEAKGLPETWKHVTRKYYFAKLFQATTTDSRQKVSQKSALFSSPCYQPSKTSTFPISSFLNLPFNTFQPFGALGEFPLLVQRGPFALNKAMCTFCLCFWPGEGV
ncbi:hypothetical protein VP01_953g3 [Puccinia sorghi]|uniref:Uncharacterized protein n=1 Tax=Puccinia sorghi TaxID=27349 RepID=A0A0L6U8E5_9BASI|nr:hypothetical protein VP01_953g3 [Puccinia sorghi]